MRDGGADLTGQVTATYYHVRLVPRDFGSLAYGHFQTASVKHCYQTVRKYHFNLQTLSNPAIQEVTIYLLTHL